MEDKYNYLKGLSEKVNKIVFAIIKEFIEWEELSEAELFRLQDLDYCKNVFGIGYPLLIVNIDNDENSSYYCNESVSSYGNEYYICKSVYLYSNERYLVWLQKWIDINKKWEVLDVELLRDKNISFEKFCTVYELGELDQLYEDYMYLGYEDMWG